MPNRGLVAIIGAGLSGLSCAQALRMAGVETRIFDEAGRVGGRCATRLWQGHLVDDGVQYFTAESLEFKRELLTNLRQFRPLTAPILDGNGKVIHSESGPRLYVLQGNNYFAHVLARDLDVRLDTKVETVTFKESGVECLGEEYSAIVSSVSAPLTSGIFSLGQAPVPAFDSRLTVILEYGGSNVGHADDCYARVLPNGSEPLAASFCENHKSGRVLGEKTVFVLEAGAEFSAADADFPDEDIVPALARAHEELWKISSGKPTASFVHRWRFSLPGNEAQRPLQLPRGAFICGDSRWDSKVEAVWLEGQRAATEVLAYLAG